MTEAWRPPLKSSEATAELAVARLPKELRGIATDPLGYYCTVLRLKEEQLRRQEFLSIAETDYAVKRAQEEGALPQLYTEIMGRIASGTEAFKYTDELWSAFTDTSDGPSIYSTTIVEWGATLKDGVLGQYFPNQGKMSIASSIPNHSEELVSLAITGQRADPFLTYYHETTHALQDRLGSPNIPAELKEAHAFRVANIVDLNSALYSALSPWVKENYPDNSYAKFDSEKTFAAIRSVESLVAFGLSQREIITIMQNTGAWNPDIKNWKEIREAIEIIKKERQLDDRNVSSIMVMSGDEDKIAIEQSRLIAQEVLYKKFKDEIDKRRDDNDKKKPPTPPRRPSPPPAQAAVRIRLIQR